MSAPRMHLQLGEPRVALNSVRVKFKDADRDTIRVMSDLDQTYKLASKSDESVCFTDRDLVILKNISDRRVAITLSAIQLRDGRYCVLHPSRQATRKLFSPADSRVRSTLTLELGPGEACPMHSSEWQSRLGGGGAPFPV